MQRRQFIKAIAASAIVWPVSTLAQQLTPVIGFLDPTSSALQSDRSRALRQGLKETGFVEGENVAIQYRWAEGQYDRLRVLVADLVRHPVAVIVTGGGTPTALAAKSATETIPIVFVLGFNPVQFGLVESLARPGGNVTGVTVLDVELIAKGFELLHELVPAATTIGVLVNPNNLLIEAQTREAQIAARNLGVHVLILNARSQSEVEMAFTMLVDQRANALLCYRRAVVLRHSEVTTRRTGSPPCGCNSISVSSVHSSWRSDGLRDQSGRCVSDNRCIRRSHSHGREAGGLAGAAVDKGGTGYQS